jgi:putative transposase
MHISFKTKYYHKVFEYEKVRNLCTKIFLEVAEEMKIDVCEIGFDKNHIHMDIDMGLWSVVDIAKTFKGTSGRKILDTFPRIKKKYFWGSGFWSPVVYFDSVGNNRDYIRKYVREQGKQLKIKEFFN